MRGVSRGIGGTAKTQFGLVDFGNFCSTAPSSAFTIRSGNWLEKAPSPAPPALGSRPKKSSIGRGVLLVGIGTASRPRKNNGSLSGKTTARKFGSRRRHFQIKPI